MQAHLQQVLEELVDGTLFVAWGVAPRDAAPPMAVLQEVGGLADQSVEGPSGHFSGVVQVSCYARSYGEVLFVSDLIEAALNGYSGGPILGMFLTARRDMDAGTDIDDLLFRRNLDFDIEWRSA